MSHILDAIATCQQKEKYSTLSMIQDQSTSRILDYINGRKRNIIVSKRTDIISVYGRNLYNNQYKGLISISYRIVYNYTLK